MMSEQIFTNNVKKGERVRLRNDWEAVMLDNLKGNIRYATVEGDFTESGSIYAHDIMAVQRNDEWLPVTHTPAQNKLRAELEVMGW
jgi:hypothetical protein